MKKFKEFYFELVWVFKNLGLVSGCQYLFDSLKRKFKKKASAPRFENLSDQEAAQVAYAYGIFAWRDRKDLNQQWCNLEKNMRNYRENNNHLH